MEVRGVPIAAKESSILLTLRELERWKEREARLTDPVEREQASRQVAYYSRLVSRMKRSLNPTNLTSVVRSFLR